MIFLLWKKTKLYVKKRLKNDTNIVEDKTISLILELMINSRLFTGKNPPEDIKDNDKLNELKALMSDKYNIKIWLMLKLNI